MNFRGYIFSREFSDGSFVDQNIQNFIIRRSCEKNSFNFKLSATEYGMKDCFLMLEKLIQDLRDPKIDGIAFYTIFQLPNESLQKKLFSTIFKKKKKIYFSKQDILISHKKDLEELDQLMDLIKIQKECLKSLNLFS